MKKSSDKETMIHGTCIQMPRGKGVLLLGESGAGKSDLALRLLGRGCRLVADDQVVIKRQKDALHASAANSIKGLLEVRGIGIAKLGATASTPLVLVVQLGQPIERLPEPMQYRLLGMELPKFELDPFEVSAVDKLFLAYQIAMGNITLTSGFMPSRKRK